MARKTTRQSANPAKKRKVAVKPAKAVKAAKTTAKKPAGVKPRAGGRSQPKGQPKGAEPADFGKVKPWTQKEITDAFRRFQSVDPAPKGELEHVNAFTLLVAVVLSAQATDAGVNKATRALFKAADTPEKMRALGEEKVRDFIKTIGLFRTKAKNVIALSEQLIARYDSVVPGIREQLEELPGVGRKTANVVLNMAFGHPTMAVDTHVFRVSNRTGLAPGKTVLDVELKLCAVIPPEFMMHAHHWLILHGRYTCLARKPLCEKCIIADLCNWPGKTVPA